MMQNTSNICTSVLKIVKELIFSKLTRDKSSITSASWIPQASFLAYVLDKIKSINYVDQSCDNYLSNRSLHGRLQTFWERRGSSHFTWTEGLKIGFRSQTASDLQNNSKPRFCEKLLLFLTGIYMCNNVFVSPSKSHRLIIFLFNCCSKVFQSNMES